MSENAKTVSGAPCWIDLFSSDQERARTFYGTLLGWEGEAGVPEFGGYFSFRHDGGRVAGCMGHDPADGIPDMWSVYLQVDDARATVDQAAQRGGTVIAPAMEVADLGTMAVITDPVQAAVGVWQPGTLDGLGDVGAPGTPVWFELHTRDYPAAVSFFEDVFGWQTHVVSDTDQFRYCTLGKDDEGKAGIMDASAYLPPGIPGYWAVYFEVVDADAAVALAVQLGGSVVDGPEDTPYGRLATLADPFGATFKVVAHN